MFNCIEADVVFVVLKNQIKFRGTFESFAEPVKTKLGHGGGLVVSDLAYCSEDPSSNHAGN